MLLLSHGQASVERGFSTNKQLERTNMCHETFIAERLVNDKVTSVGVMAVEMTKELLTSCRASRSRYTAYLEDARLKRLGDAVCLKRKCVIDEVDELKAKRVQLEGDVTELTIQSVRTNLQSKQS